jgi:ribonuclease J
MENADNIVMIVRSSMYVDFSTTLRNLSKGNIIFSMWSGYKNNAQNEKLISLFMSHGLIVKDIHTSGHADFETLNKLVAAMEPKTIIPIHTGAAENYKALFPDNNILVVEDGKEIGGIHV